jgi:hypothetical protein
MTKKAIGCVERKQTTDLVNTKNKKRGPKSSKYLSELLSITPH